MKQDLFHSLQYYSLRSTNKREKCYFLQGTKTINITTHIIYYGKKKRLILDTLWICLQIRYHRTSFDKTIQWRQSTLIFPSHPIFFIDAAKTHFVVSVFKQILFVSNHVSLFHSFGRKTNLLILQWFCQALKINCTY